VKAICVPGGADLSRKALDDLTDFAVIYGAKGMAWIKRNEEGWHSPIAKFFFEEHQAALEKRTSMEVGDLVLFCADKPRIVQDTLGNLRNEIARQRGLIPENEFRFVWVTDFPLFEYSEAEKRFVSSHHPFTMPNLEDLEAYGQDQPERIRSRAYDITLNGVEIGGGGIRIHRGEIQVPVFCLLVLAVVGIAR
jgi:Aspartyl-tRNA synthetase